MKNLKPFKNTLKQNCISDEKDYIESNIVFLKKLNQNLELTILRNSLLFPKLDSKSTLLKNKSEIYSNLVGIQYTTMNLDETPILKSRITDDQIVIFIHKKNKTLYFLVLLTSKAKLYQNFVIHSYLG